MADAVTRHSKGPTGSLCVQCGLTHSLPAHLNPARPSADIFVLAGDIRSQWKRLVGQSGQTKEPVGGRQGGGGVSWGNARDREGYTDTKESR